MKNRAPPHDSFECNRRNSGWTKYHGAPTKMIAGRKVRLLQDNELKDWHERFQALSKPVKKIVL